LKKELTHRSHELKALGWNQEDLARYEDLWDYSQRWGLINLEREDRQFLKKAEKLLPKIQNKKIYVKNTIEEKSYYLWLNFYLDENRLLRTHTSPVQIRYLEKNPPPVRIIAPGRVYRRDAVDATHSPVFNQVEVLCIDQDINFSHLRGTVLTFLKTFFGDIPVRFRASYFPFTEPSAEVDVQWKGKWLEVMGCGMVDPKVLEKLGIDSEKWTGFAAGLGVERFCMVRHQIDDIRKIYTKDLRFLEQF